MRKKDFLKMVEENYDKLVRRCRLPHDGPDIVNSVVAGVLAKKSYKSIDDKKSNPLPWLFTAVAHRKIDFLRRRDLENRLFVPLDDCTERASSSQAVVDLLSQCRVEIGKLPVIQQAVVEHIYLGNETYASLSKLIAISIPDLKAEARKARLSLRKALS